MCFFSYDRNNLEASGFYFADAVSGGYVRRQLEEEGELQEVWNKTTLWSLDVTAAIAELVDTYLKGKPEYKSKNKQKKDVTRHPFLYAYARASLICLSAWANVR